MDREQVIEALTQLSPEDLKEVRARALALSGDDSRSETTEEQLIHDAVVSELNAVGISSPPFSVIKSAGWMTPLRESHSAFMSYIEKFARPKSKTARMRAISVFARTVLKWMIRAELYVSYKTLTLQLRNIGSCIEDAFPGYASSGLLGVVIGGKCGEVDDRSAGSRPGRNLV